MLVGQMRRPCMAPRELVTCKATLGRRCAEPAILLKQQATGSATSSLTSSHLLPVSKQPAMHRQSKQAWPTIEPLQQHSHKGLHWHGIARRTSGPWLELICLLPKRMSDSMSPKPYIILQGHTTILCTRAYVCIPGCRARSSPWSRSTCSPCLSRSTRLLRPSWAPP